MIGKIAEGAKLTRRTAARIVAGVRPTVFAMLQNNPEEFIAKAIRLINEEKAAMIVEEITYNRTEGVYDSAIFIAETKGTMESLQLKPIEQAKIKCAKKLFAGLSDDDVVYREVDSYQSLLDIMEKL